MAPIEFHSNQIFDEKKHIVDIVAMEYVEKAAKVSADGNSLYHSILLLMDNPTVTISEMRCK